MTILKTTNSSKIKDNWILTQLIIERRLARNQDKNHWRICTFQFNHRYVLVLITCNLPKWLSNYSTGLSAKAFTPRSQAQRPLLGITVSKTNGLVRAKASCISFLKAVFLLTNWLMFLLNISMNSASPTYTNALKFSEEPLAGSISKACNALFQSCELKPHMGWKPT